MKPMHREVPDLLAQMSNLFRRGQKCEKNAAASCKVPCGSRLLKGGKPMRQITRAEARHRWNRALAVRGWQKSKLAFVMFDYDVAAHGHTNYRPAPAWSTITAPDDTADLEQYELLERALLQQGEPHSRRGAAVRSSGSIPRPCLSPVQVTRAGIVSTVQRVTSILDPRVVTQEQILRAAFFAHLPRELGEVIGTPDSAVHPERTTPSCDYRNSGTREGGMRARYDLGFGHATESADIVGVCELKAGPGTFDRVDALVRLSEGQEQGEGYTENGCPPASLGKREEPLRTDLLKLLDPELPDQAFRISWIALGKRGSATPEEIRQRAIRVVEGVARDRNLRDGTYEVDQTTGWLLCEWTKPRQVTLELAWYRPKADTSSAYEPVFRSCP